MRTKAYSKLSGPIPGGELFHGTDYFFESFALCAALGAHFGTRQAAVDRLSATGRSVMDWEVVEDDEDQWLVQVEVWANRSPVVHGPFETEMSAHEYARTLDLRRKPLAFDLDVSAPLVLQDLGTWEFAAVVRALSEAFPDEAGQRIESWYLAWNRSDAAGWEILRAFIFERGFDCVCYQNLVEDPGQWSWIALDPASIRPVGEGHPMLLVAEPGEARPRCRG